MQVVCHGAPRGSEGAAFLPAVSVVGELKMLARLNLSKT